MPQKSLSHGTIESQMQLAVRLADETAAQARKEPLPELTEYYSYTVQCFDYAVTITKWSRSPQEIEPSQFVAVWSYLGEYLKRVNELQKKYPLLLDKWPRDSEVPFSWKAGSSALDVALIFSEMIYNATLITRAFALGRFPLCLHEITTSGQEARKWRDLTIQELRTMTLPRPSEWPMWKVHRDSASLILRLEHEFLRATSKAAETEQEIAPGIFGWMKGWLWKLYEKTLKVVVDAILERVWPK
jgi:hypothetical protein